MIHSPDNFISCPSCSCPSQHSPCILQLLDSQACISVWDLLPSFFILSVVCPSQLYLHFNLHFHPPKCQDRSVIVHNAQCYIFQHTLLIIHVLPVCTSASVIRNSISDPYPLFFWVVTSLFYSSFDAVSFARRCLGI